MVVVPKHAHGSIYNVSGLAIKEWGDSNRGTGVCLRGKVYAGQDLTNPSLVMVTPGLCAYQYFVYL